ncbi:hypothetical protein D9M69_158410 [compost metagenome]
MRPASRDAALRPDNVVLIDKVGAPPSAVAPRRCGVGEHGNLHGREVTNKRVFCGPLRWPDTIWVMQQPHFVPFSTLSCAEDANLITIIKRGTLTAPV